MTILVIGSNGQLGWELCRQGVSHGYTIMPVDIPEFDITDPRIVTTTLDNSSISLLVNASAYTDVDRAESESDKAFAINRDGPAHVARACAERNIPLIHISTDYVFDGSKGAAYKETDSVSPLGVYGESKAAGEEEVREHLTYHIIIRTAWLYGVHGNNFVKTMLRLGGEREKLRVVADQYGCPTYAADLAGAILAIAERIKQYRSVRWGTYHYCGRGVTTWHGLAEKTIELAKRYEPLMVQEVEAITTADYPTPAKRPAYSVLDCTLMEHHFGVIRPLWEESLSDMIERLLGSHLK